MTSLKLAATFATSAERSRIQKRDVFESPDNKNRSQIGEISANGGSFGGSPAGVEDSGGRWQEFKSTK